MISFNMDDSFDPIFDFSINPETSLDMDSYYSCDIDDDEFAFDDEYDLDDLEGDALQEDVMLTMPICTMIPSISTKIHLGKQEDQLG